MKIIVAPDSFKGSLSSIEAAHAMRDGILEAWPEAEPVCIPLADGGEGTVSVLLRALNGRSLELDVTGPLGKPVAAPFCLIEKEKIAIFEMAAAAGLPLVPVEKRNPLVTTTYGAGELIRHALDIGCRDIWIGVGGSATVDGGTGVAEAVGIRFLDAKDRPVPRGGGGLESLARIDTSEMDARLKECRIRILCDVRNPLLGPTGAARVFGPQKGADEEMVVRLEAGLARLADQIRRQTGRQVASVPGMGAAGGFAVCLTAFTGAEIVEGAQFILEKVGLAEHFPDANVLFTGEGSIDSQCRFGKATWTAGRMAKRAGLTVVAFTGKLGDGWEELIGEAYDVVFPIAEQPSTLAYQVTHAADLLRKASRRISLLFRALKGGT